MKFRHPPPALLRERIRTRHGLLRPTGKELVVLNGVVLTGQDVVNGPVLWKYVLYGCKVKGNALRKTVTIIGAGRKTKLIFDDHAYYEKWFKELSVATSWRLQNYYDVEEEIGSGKYSTVYRAWEKRTKLKVAVKVVWRTESDAKASSFIERERRIMQCIEHRSIIKAYDIFDEPSKLCIVLEYMEGGVLSNVLKKEKTFSEKNASDIMRNLFIALEFLHRNNIVHRDVKPDNMLCPASSWPLDVKLADFGLSNFLDEDGHSTLNSGVGTPYYVAPEMVQKKAYGCSVDMWSSGVLLYLLLVGKFPFKAYSKTETLKKIREGKYRMDDKDWADISDDAKDLVSKLLVCDPKKRLTSAQALNHKWIKGSNQSTYNLGTSRLLVALNAIERGREWTAANRQRIPKEFGKSISSLGHTVERRVSLFDDISTPHLFASSRSRPFSIDEGGPLGKWATRKQWKSFLPAEEAVCSPLKR
eukprot:Plantae.Rhodophyta-Purpureofilum_apyrenoidigerum.ctg867.p1 GENE.Plantae.Rhodophyta-Purpureofilum_apyrenoidigerum.ctg867~~Plantae.Rhodophyta-Purpureofilum_apyrenoidigerum.ctg867.p1  ORF type:complete len:473 (+),score=88.87 Plantae.Rhodophyta-Purpureofilum_apyrenoidigerum.ctg867:81-1499(+)